MRHLENVMREDGPADESLRTARRQELVAKVLASEGVSTDANVVLRVADAMPRVFAETDPTADELRDLANYLDANLAALL